MPPRPSSRRISKSPRRREFSGGLLWPMGRSALGFGLLLGYPLRPGGVFFKAAKEHLAPKVIIKIPVQTFGDAFVEGVNCTFPVTPRQARKPNLEVYSALLETRCAGRGHVSFI